MEKRRVGYPSPRPYAGRPQSLESEVRALTERVIPNSSLQSSLLESSEEIRCSIVLLLIDRVFSGSAFVVRVGQEVLIIEQRSSHAPLGNAPERSFV